MPRGPRGTKIAPGIYRDAIGHAALVTAGGTQHERRFPAAATLGDMQAWQRRVKARAEFPDLPAETRTTTLQQDVTSYLALLPEGGYRRDTAILLRHWTDAHGASPRARLTAAAVQQQMMAWTRDGKSAGTANHCRRALIGLYKALDGPSAACPAKDVAKLPVPRRAPRGLPWPVVLHLVAHFPANVSGDRLRVLAHTGWPAAILMRVTASDLHLTGAPYALVQPRRKGKGVPAFAYPLTPPAAAALRALVKRNGLGTFSTSSLRKSFLVAVAHAQAAWRGRWPRRAWPVPADCTVYDLRHSFLTRVYAVTGRQSATAELGMHADERTTRRYTEAAVSASASATRDLLTGTATGTEKPNRKSR